MKRRPQFFGKFIKKYKRETQTKKTYIDGEFDEINDDQDKKL